MDAVKDMPETLEDILTDGGDYDPYQPPETMFELRKYVLNRRNYAVAIGDMVTPDTIVGRHFRTGRPVKAGICGQVMTIYRNTDNHHVLLLAVAGTEN